ncbi:MAG TPA: hypothetical protein VLG92_03805 [Candidatus Saccharimonadia bacterium]|nr:hypothetical protein [Candidatus Saccharimonadia bacterium]
MGENSYTTEIVRDGKTLILFAANLRHEGLTASIGQITSEAFGRLAKYFKEDKQVLYISDAYIRTAKSEWLWSMDFNGITEATISMPRWGDDTAQIENLTFAVNQALYTLVRRQHVGASTWFGAEALNRGFSAYYAETVIGVESPPKSLIQSDRFRRLHMARHWIRPYEAYYGRWKPQEIDLWVATAVGFEIAQLLTGEDDPLDFCLGDGLSWHGFGSDSLLWVLSHPRRRRSSRILEGKVNQPRWSFYRLMEKMPAKVDQIW